MRRFLKRMALILLGLILLAGVALGIVGFPTPPSITADNVARISWTSAFRAWSGTRPLFVSRRFAGWYQNERKMLVGVGPGEAIRLVDAPGAEPTRLPGMPERARWLAQSRDTPQPYLVYPLDEGGSELFRLYRYDYATHTSTPLTTAPARISFTVFDRAGRRLAFASTERNGTDSDVYTLDVTRPASKKMVYEGTGDFSVKAWSQDGALLLVGRTDASLYLLDVERGVLRQVLAEYGPSARFPWSDAVPDRTRPLLHLLGDLGGEFAGVQALDPASGTVTPLTRGLPWDVVDVQALADGNTLALLANEDARHVLYLLDLTQHTLRRVERTPAAFLSGIAAHPTLPLLAVDVVASDSAEGVWTYDVQADRFEPWSVPPAREALPAPEVVRYPTFDKDGGGPRMISAVVLPAAARFPRPRPVVIDLHGGPAAQSMAAPDARLVGVRELGITVIRPNVRGSAGYGRTFQSLDDRERRGDAVRDVGALLDWIPSRTDLDARRVAVVGGSYGGYMTLASLVDYSDRLRCGFELFGISDIPSFIEESTKGHFAESQRAEYGDERDPKMRAFLASISPAAHAERIKVPLVIFQGANDVRVKPRQSREMVARIRAAGGQVQYIEAADEGHGLERAPNGFYVTAAGLSFIERCLLQPARP